MTPHVHDLCLPSLPVSIPETFVLRGGTEMSAKLAIALLELDMITDADLQPASALLTDVFAPVDEKVLVERALTRWWNVQTSRLQQFRWSLQVTSLADYYGYPRTDDPWFCVALEGDIPQFSLALRVGQLEAAHAGFGQTVLAVLYDAMRYLPEAFTPLSVLWLAEFHYWGGHPNEDGWIEDQLEYSDYKTREEFAANIDFFRRADYFLNMPEWAALPRRVCSREELERAARSTLEKDVIAACDDIWSLVTSPRFRRPKMDAWDAGVRDLQADPTEGFVLLRWSDEDACIRVLDDAIGEAFNAGETTDFISARKVTPTKEALRTYFRQTENMLELAALVERLILLLGTNSSEAPQ